MKTIKIVAVLLMALATFNCEAQSQSQDVKQTQDKSDATDRYRLYPTQNMWTFLKLDTQDGRIWQIQWTLDDVSKAKVYNTLTSINLIPLIGESEKRNNGRFELYPTSNLYNFILMDQIEGRIWQVQWSQDISQRAIISLDL